MTIREHPFFHGIKYSLLASSLLLSVACGQDITQNQQQAAATQTANKATHTMIREPSGLRSEFIVSSGNRRG